MARKPADQSVDREDILWAAAEVLHRNGYEATTMKDIAAQVNLTAASLYHHFKNKDFLLLNVLEVGIDYTIAKLEAVAVSDMTNAREAGRYDPLACCERHRQRGGRRRYGFRNPRRAKCERQERRRQVHGMSSPRAGMQFFARRDYFEGLFRGVLRAGHRRRRVPPGGCRYRDQSDAGRA